SQRQTGFAFVESAPARGGERVIERAQRGVQHRHSHYEAAFVGLPVMVGGEDAKRIAVGLRDDVRNAEAPGLYSLRLPPFGRELRLAGAAAECPCEFLAVERRWKRQLGRFHGASGATFNA